MAVPYQCGGYRFRFLFMQQADYMGRENGFRKDGSALTGIDYQTPGIRRQLAGGTGCFV